MPAEKTVYTYDPKEKIITFGPVIISGFSDGDYLTIESSSDGFTKRKGADGTIDRINNNVFDYIATLIVTQTSPVNDQLSLIYNSDKLLNTGILPLVVKDLGGTSFFIAPQAWIRKDPNDVNGDSLGSREWVFDTGTATKFTGGNVRVGGE